MKNFLSILLTLSVSANRLLGQNFDPNPITFAPSNLIEFKLNYPITHLDVNNYVPSTRGVYANRNVAFHFFNRPSDWPTTNLFVEVRWDNDFDASNGITWSDWYQDENYGHYASVNWTYSTPGKYLLTFELRFFNSAGQSYSRQKEIEIYVAPFPTAVYKDQSNNGLYYWVGDDQVFDKPALLVEGFDPTNSTSAADNYVLGFDLIQLARSQGYDILILDWADGGADLTSNKDVFLGACQFLHTKLGNTEGALQVVGISMGGTVVRYGPAYAEDNLAHPGQFMEHYVNTFVSFDGPQQGAHVNSTLQSYLKDNGNASQQITLSCLAARELLYEDTYGSLHDAFFNTLRSINDGDATFGNTNGYPRRCKNSQSRTATAILITPISVRMMISRLSMSTSL